MKKFRFRGVLLFAGGGALFLYYAFRWPPYTPAQLKAEPMLLESHPPGIALLVLLTAIILSTIGLLIFFLDYQKWPKKIEITR